MKTGVLDRFFQQLDASNPSDRRDAKTQLIAAFVGGSPIADRYRLTDPDELNGVAELVREAGLTIAIPRLLGTLRRESVFFDEGGFTRLRPWFDQILDALERLQSLQIVKPDDAAATASNLGASLSRNAVAATPDDAGGTPPSTPPNPGVGEALQDFLGFTSAPTARAIANLLLSLEQKFPPPPQPLRLADLFRTSGDASSVAEAASSVLFALEPQLEGKLGPALTNFSASIADDATPLPRVEVLRASAAPFGVTAPPRQVSLGNNASGNPVVTVVEWPLAPVGVSVRAVATAAPTVSMTVAGRTETQSVPFSGSAAFHSNITISSSSTVTSGTVTGFTLRITAPSGPNGVDEIRTLEVSNLGSSSGDLNLKVDGNETLARLQVNQPREARLGPWRLTASRTTSPDAIAIDGEISLPVADADRRLLLLDAVYDKIRPASSVVIDKAAVDATPAAYKVSRADEVDVVAASAYNVTAKVTRLKLDQPWIDEQLDVGRIRNLRILAQAESLDLAERPYEADISGQRIEVAGVLEGLQPGRVLIVEGERTDIPGTRGVRAAERAVLNRSFQAFDIPDPQSESKTPIGRSSRPHTVLELASPLQFSYRRDTAKIYANVVRATHGETQSEVLGSGDASRPRQEFTLKQAPLTHRAAATPVGSQPELTIYVNDLKWERTDHPAASRPDARAYYVRLDEAGQATIRFGNAVGARLPTGVENVRSVYRYGLGAGGNVAAGQISQLGQKPLGLRDVINPLPAAGGAGREPDGQLRANIPSGLSALDRLISASDYEDLTRSFAGIAKARALAAPSGRHRRVFVTFAGQDDMDIPPDSDLYKALVASLTKFGDPDVEVTVARRRLKLLFIEAEVWTRPDAAADIVAADARAGLLKAFGFENRALGRPTYASEVIATLQRTTGVAGVRLTIFSALPEQPEPSETGTSSGTPAPPPSDSPQGGDPSQRIQTPDSIARAVRRMAEEDKVLPFVKAEDIVKDKDKDTYLPAELAYLSPRATASLVLIMNPTARGERP
jgi:hypothetical protein